VGRSRTIDVSLKAAEEEQFVFQDRSADYAAELLRFSVSRAGAKKFRALKSPFRRNSKRVP